MDAIKEYKKYYKDFNKKYFNGELPEVEIKIEKPKDKKAVGAFIYTASLKHQDGKKEKFFDIKKAVFSKKADQSQKDEWEDIIADSYIAMPKDAFGKGKYYWASILLHEMCHVYQRLVSDSMEQADHGHDFKKKVDEINKKSKNEWRVGYEELDSKLVSDEPIEERPEDLEESKKATEWVKKLLESVLPGDWQVTVLIGGKRIPVNEKGTYTSNDTPASYSSRAEALAAKEKFEKLHPSKTFEIANSNRQIDDVAN